MSLDAAQARDWARQYLARTLNLEPEQIDLARGFGEFGLDSADAVIMAAEIEEHFGVELDPAILLRYATVEEMLAAAADGTAATKFVPGNS